MPAVAVELASLEELEPALAREEFDVARVFIGYGASAPSAPEPIRLPKVAYSLERPATPTGRFRTGEWHETWSPAAYAAAIETVRHAIHEGDVYQVNLVQHLWAEFSGDPLALAAALAPLRPLEPGPLQGDGWTIVSASPELLLQKRCSIVRTSPIKGTRPAGVPIESEKDAAEHVMIVDLERNDLSRVCIPGTVRWPELLAERQLAGVTHLVATVEGELRPGVTLTELLEAVLPGGSVTGCPKSSALELIAALEPVAGGAIHLWVGGGIVWDSEAEAEIEESWVKARPLLALA